MILFGIIIGCFLTFLSQYILSKRQIKVKFIEKIVENKIKAYDELYYLLKILKFIDINRIDDSLNQKEALVRYPIVLKDFNTFLVYCNEVISPYNKYSHLFSIDLIRLFNFLQDYLINLEIIIKKHNPEQIIEIGFNIKEDFIDLSSEFDKIMYKFYNNDIYKLKINIDINKWHKFKKYETNIKLQNTSLYKYYISKKLL
ncbi:hypothetical protein [Leptospira kirschneri]|uniref:hypothetical protein n=1 Tax=Leptospira kirschneri TaxID=29507 RepID=UPI0002BF4858|nr:hypothetical protein [Leptospira kirschneri]EMN25374.1 hypothetical protein LEP1GSC065_2297 [Leptospira kirschneri serovar Sokoine str. RM1]